MNKRAIVIHERDDVAVALEPISAGDEALAQGAGTEQRITARQDVPFGFKIALRAIRSGQPVHKYGAPIGRASRDIAAGDMVHIHNLGGARGRGDLAASSTETAGARL